MRWGPSVHPPRVCEGAGQATVPTDSPVSPGGQESQPLLSCTVCCRPRTKWAGAGGGEQETGSRARRQPSTCLPLEPPPLAEDPARLPSGPGPACSLRLLFCLVPLAVSTPPYLEELRRESPHSIIPPPSALLSAGGTAMLNEALPPALARPLAHQPRLLNPPARNARCLEITDA